VLVDDMKCVAPARSALHGFGTRRMMLTMCPSCRAFEDKEERVERFEKWNGGPSGGASFIASMLRAPGPQHRPQLPRWGASLSRGAWPCTNIAPLGFPKTSRRTVLHECAGGSERLCSISPVGTQGLHCTAVVAFA
jgi:hypothetical protein